jgi:hypothetical protein
MADEDERPGRAWAFGREMRTHRAWLLEGVAAGTMTLDGLLDDDERTAPVGSGTVKVVVLAEKVPGVGKVRARRAMETLGIAEDARFGEVDEAVLRDLWVAMADAAGRPL